MAGASERGVPARIIKYNQRRIRQMDATKSLSEDGCAQRNER